MTLFETKVKMWQLWKKYILNMFKSEREEYHIGWVTLNSQETNIEWKPTDKNVEEVEKRLIDIGYQPNYFSFGDEGQITSMRKMFIYNTLWLQWHVRIHKDGEIRGHEEFSYEEDAVRHKNGDYVIRIPKEERDIIINKLSFI